MEDASTYPSLDTFSNQITSNVLRYALEQVAEIGDYSIDIEAQEEFFQQLINCSNTNNDDSPLSELLEVDLEETKTDLPGIINQQEVHAKCCELIERVFDETYMDIKSVLEEERLAMAEEAAARQRQIQLLECIQTSGHIQNMFESMSGVIIQSALQQVKEESIQMNNDFESNTGREYLPEGAWGDLGQEGDILEVNIHERQENNNSYIDDDSDFSNEQEPYEMDVKISNVTTDTTFGNSATKSIYFDAQCENYKVHDQNPDSTLSEKAGFTTANSTMFNVTTMQQDSQCESYKHDEHPDSTLSEKAGFTTANSTMFNVTTMQQDSQCESYKHNENPDSTLPEKAGFVTANSTLFDMITMQEDFLNFEPAGEEHFASFAGDEGPVLHDHSEPVVNTPTCDKYQNELDKTLTQHRVPRQSTPLSSQDEEPHLQQMCLKSAENSENQSILDSAQHSTNENKSLNDSELEVFIDDDASSSPVSTPRTLSRQSSAFGNVTLEFDHEWESGIHDHSFHSNEPSGEAKHAVVLHELSFDERADLRALELLGPVYLAVQDDDDEDARRRHKLSQSIDDLCEMISDEEDETELPPRKRAMSLETRTSQISKNKSIKVPTREELMRAFQELRNEIMEAKDLNEEVEEKGEQENDNEIEPNEEVVKSEGQYNEGFSEDGEERGEHVEEIVDTDTESEEQNNEDFNEEVERRGEHVDDREIEPIEEIVDTDIESEELNNEDVVKSLKGRGDSNLTPIESDDEKEEGERNVEVPPLVRPEGDDPLRWQTVVFNGQHKVIDLKILEPFLKVLTHGGYHHEDGKKSVIVVLTACNLPDRNIKKYGFIMEQLFFFLVSTMDILITSDEYIFVYFHGGADKNQSPTYSWLKKYYQYIDRRLRKSVTNVYIVHPNFWLKSIYRLSRPFLSSNFARKLKFVNSVRELSRYIQTDFIHIPDEVISIDPDYKKIHAR